MKQQRKIRRATDSVYGNSMQRWESSTDMLCTLYELSEGASLDYWALSSPPNPSVSKIWIYMSGRLRSNMATWAVLKFYPSSWAE